MSPRFWSCGLLPGLGAVYICCGIAGVGANAKPSVCEVLSNVRSFSAVLVPIFVLQI